MIGFLSGRVLQSSPSQTIVLVGGVGYSVQTPQRAMLSVDQSVNLYIYTHVRENEISLFGFEKNEDLETFKKLLDVSGIGPKSALAILSVADSSQIKSAITSSNLSFFTSISGIGKKTAQRLLVELSSKFSKQELDLANLDRDSDLMVALKELGFSRNEIISVLNQIDQNLSLSDQIKGALKLLRHG